MLKAVDTAAGDPGHGYQRFADIINALVVKLTAHLAHEESDGLPLIDASLTAEEWQYFSPVHTERLRSDAPTYMRWLLNEASRRTLRAVLSKLPRPLLAAYREQWGPKYARLNIWNPPSQKAS